MTITTHTESGADDGVQAAALEHVDHAQIAELIKTQYGGLLSLVRRKLKDRDLAADLVNEAIAITLGHARLGRLKQVDRIGGYVFQVSMNLLRNHQRNIHNRAELRADDTVLASLAAHEYDGIEAAQIRQKTVRLIESLSEPRDREVIKRFYLDEEDKQVICQELGLTALQFTQVMSRARQRMRQIFESQGLKRGDFFSMAALGIALIQCHTPMYLCCAPQHMAGSQHMSTCSTTLISHDID